MMMHKNCEALLMDYAAGTLDQILAVTVESYLVLSPEGRSFVSQCEAIGGAMVECMCEPEEMSAGCLESVLAKIDCSAGDCTEAMAACVQTCVECCDPIPQPLSRFLPAGTAVQWKKAFGGMQWVDIPVAGCHTHARLIKSDPGFMTPQHTHRGVEITLVLNGSFEDDTGRYVRGDLVIMDEDTTHQPVADGHDGCLCLTVTTHPIRFTGFFTRLLNPFA